MSQIYKCMLWNIFFTASSKCIPLDGIKLHLLLFLGERTYDIQLKLKKSNTESKLVKLPIYWWARQIVSPISNFEFANIFNKHLFWLLFQLADWEKNRFWTNKKCVFFFNCSKLRKIRVDKIGETNWWKHRMNLLYVDGKCI